jgi:uncharacterized protein
MAKNDYKGNQLQGNQSSTTTTSIDTRTRILPVARTQINLDEPILIVGFPDNGMIGSIRINYMIEQLAMHQITFVESEYVMPAALFIGKKFRHPFRIYANDKGNICAMICEVPVILRGVPSITNAIINWANNSQSRQVTVVGGIAPSNFSPSFLLDRKALLLQNTALPQENGSIASANELASGSENDKNNNNQAQNKNSKILIPDSAIVPGLTGSLLSSCATRDISCTAIMVPTLGDVPDPEGAALVLEALDEIVPTIAMDTSELRREAEEIKKRLEEFMKMHQRHMLEYEQAAADRPAVEGIYK